LSGALCNRVKFQHFFIPRIFLRRKKNFKLTHEIGWPKNKNLRFKKNSTLSTNVNILNLFHLLNFDFCPTYLALRCVARRKAQQTCFYLSLSHSLSLSPSRVRTCQHLRKEKREREEEEKKRSLECWRLKIHVIDDKA
jgi:hypothetical protein